jgi:predicted GIY-YIG superfamily endonuclease
MYIIERDKKLYIGYTNDLVRRFEQHARDYKCALLYYEAYISEKSARNREWKLKQYGSAWQGLKKRILEEGGLGNDFKVAPAR